MPRQPNTPLTFASGGQLETVNSMCLKNVKSQPKDGIENTPTSTPSPARKKEKPNWMTKSTDQIIRTINASSLKPCAAIVSSDPGFQELCSYSWREHKPATIFVPGSPNLWTPHDIPFKLAEDTGLYERDHDAARAPRYPFEPMFQAAAVMNPSFCFDNIHLVTSRNSLRKLLDFASGRNGSSFRIDLQVVDKTLFLIRRERNPTGLIGGSNGHGGYGHNFERMFTTTPKGLKAAVSHNRTIKFPLGGLDCVVQFEVDAYCMELSKSERVQAFTPKKRRTRKKAASAAAASTPASDPVSTLKSGLETLSINDEERKKCTTTSFKPTNVIQKGEHVLSNSLVEMKSKSAKSRIWAFLPQLWFGRIPYLMLGIHKEGLITQLDCTDVAELFPEWEQRNQVQLQKLVQLIKELRKAVLKTGGQNCVLLYNHKAKPMRLEIYTSRQTRRVLPDEIIRRHWRTTGTT